MIPNLQSFCIHLNGKVDLPDGRKILCRDLSSRVYNDTNRYCMRNWSNKAKLTESFINSNKVCQSELNAYAHYFSTMSSLGSLINALINKDQHKFLIAFSQHLAVVKFFYQQNDICYQLYDPNHTNQVFERSTTFKKLETNIALDFIANGWDKYTTAENSVCIMTQNSKQLLQPIIYQELTWNLVEMLLRFEEIDLIIESLNRINKLVTPTYGSADSLITPRKILPLINIQSLARYITQVSASRNSLSHKVFAYLLGLDVKPTAFDILKNKYPLKHDILIQELKNRSI